MFLMFVYCKLSLVYLHVCLTCFWIVFEMYDCFFVLTFFWNMFLFVSQTCFTIYFASLNFVGWCSLFGLFLTLFSNDCWKVCLICFWCYFEVSVVTLFDLLICFDLVFIRLFDGLFDTFLVLFFERILLLCFC